MSQDSKLWYDADKQILLGTRKKEYIDKETGEVMMVEQTAKRVYAAKSFWKVYLHDFLNILGMFNNKQVDILIYILQNTHPSTNYFVGTYAQIATKVNVSEPTIAKIMKKFQNANFIKKVQRGVWCINPNVLVKGDDNKRERLLEKYYNKTSD